LADCSNDVGRDPADAPTGLIMKLMPSPMIAAGTRKVNQNSSTFHFNTELFNSAFMLIFPFAGQMGVELASGIRIVDSTLRMSSTSKPRASLTASGLCM